MTKASDNDFPSLLLTEQGSAPSSPAASHQRLYIRTSDHTLVTVNSSGTVAPVATSSYVSGEVSHNTFTSPVSITATTEASANTIVTATALAADGSQAYIIEFFCEGANGPASTTITLNFHLFDGSTSLGYWGYKQNPSATATDISPVLLRHRIVPSNASHTYSVRASVSSAGTGTIQAGAGGAGNNWPGYIRITKA